jgi:hypothetical protein
MDKALADIINNTVRLVSGLNDRIIALEDMVKDPKIKGFYYCDPPGGVPTDDDLVKDAPAVSNPPCFNCDSVCIKCEKTGHCPLLNSDLCSVCSSAGNCFS